MKEMERPGIYERYIKRILDILCSAAAIILLSWLYLLVAVLVRVKLGSPVLFKQMRPGKDEKIFNMCKFRTMSDVRDKDGNLLSDEERLTKFGRWLRETSLDELPEIFLILKGDMALLGPRPLLVRDMVFMSEEHRRRHSVRPGLSGLAQVHGRNDIDWEDKLNYDIRYVDNITFWGDVKILFRTVIKVFGREGITEKDMATATDYGDYLLQKGMVSQEEYDEKQDEAKRILEKTKQGAV